MWVFLNLLFLLCAITSLAQNSPGSTAALASYLESRQTSWASLNTCFAFNEIRSQGGCQELQGQGY